jgi:multicomponent Na+:H+ antiporter subunit E
VNRDSRRYAKGATFAILFTFWVLLSGYFDAFHLAAGVVSSLLVTLISYDLLVSGHSRQVPGMLWRFIGYLLWLSVEIFIAGFDVAYRVLHPKMPIDPSVIVIETPLRDDRSQTTLANSITLTPGSLALDVKDGRFVVHTLDPKFSRSLVVEGTMQKKVADVFMEDR